MNSQLYRCGFVLSVFLTACGPEKPEPGWIDLFDGKTLQGWVPTSEANWFVEDGVISASEGPAGFLTYETGLENFVLEVGFRAEEETNSGVFVRFDGEPTNPAVDCYEINIAPPDNPFPTGSIVARARVSPNVTPNEWHSFEIVVFNGSVQIALNGETILEHEADPVSSGGWIGLQLREGLISFREIRVRAK